MKSFDGRGAAYGFDFSIVHEDGTVGDRWLTGSGVDRRMDQSQILRKGGNRG